MMLQQGPDTSQIYIESFAHEGEGCPEGSVSHDLTGDKKALTLLFDRFVADSSKVAGNEAEKQCRIKIQMHVPLGWSFASYGVDYRGYADLERGVDGKQSSSYQFGVLPGTQLPEMQIAGPVTKDYFHSVEMPTQPLSFSPCVNLTQSLTIDTKLKVHGQRPFQNGQGPDQGVLTVDAMDGELEQRYGLVWKPCVGGTYEVRCPVVGSNLLTGERHVFWGVGISATQLTAQTEAIAAGTLRCNHLKELKPQLGLLCTPQVLSCVNHS